jgi:hypothetical protein
VITINLPVRFALGARPAAALIASGFAASARARRR